MLYSAYIPTEIIFEVEHVIIQRDHFLKVFISLNSSDLHGEDAP